MIGNNVWNLPIIARKGQQGNLERLAVVVYGSFLGVCGSLG